MRKSSITRVLALALAVVFVLSLALTGCGTKKETTEATTAEGTTAAAAQETTAAPEPKQSDMFKDLSFTWYVHYDWATYMGEWGADPTSKWMKENLGVDVKWVFSGGAAKQKLSTMIASNEVPDVITMDRGPELESLVKNGVLVPFDDYYGKYPNFQKWGGNKLVNALRSTIDQKWYGMPSWYTNEKYPLGNAGWIVNLKIYNEMGKPKLETMDDLYSYLKAVKEKHPDIKPLSPSSSNVFYACFGENRITDLAALGAYIDGDQLKTLFEDPAYKEFLQFANKLYREGLLAGEEFAMKSEQIDEKFNNGKVAIAPVGDALGGTAKKHDAFRKLDPQGGYMTIYPPIKAGLDRSKVKPASYQMVGWNVTTITQAAKSPEAIYAFLDWLTGEEGQAISFRGPQGLYWDEKIEYEGVMVPKMDNDKYKNNKEQFSKDMGAFGFNWVPNGAWAAVESAYFDGLTPKNEGDWDNQGYAKITRSTAAATDEFAGITPDPTTNEGIAYSSVKEIFSKQAVKAILAKTPEDCDKAIGEAVEQANKLGFDKVLQFMTEQWHKKRDLMNK